MSTHRSIIHLMLIGIWLVNMWGGVVHANEAPPPPDTPVSQEESAPALPLTPPDVQARYAAADAVQAELMAFDAARNAGPEAVQAFAATASPARQALLVDELADLPLTPESTEGVPFVAAINNGPCAFTSVQAAINAAPTTGANVLVVGQVLSEAIDVAGRTITLTGGYDANCTNPVVRTHTTLRDCLKTRQIRGRSGKLGG